MYLYEITTREMAPATQWANKDFKPSDQYVKCKDCFTLMLLLSCVFYFSFSLSFSVGTNQIMRLHLLSEMYVCFWNFTLVWGVAYVQYAEIVYL